MAESIYKIPVSEAFDASLERKKECPFCRLYDILEENELEIILGGAMMEPDIRIRTNKQAAKLLEAYVYRIIGRWKDARGVEYTFRRDGSCCIAGEEGYFGGSGYDIAVGAEKYPTKAVYSVVSLRNKTLTLKNLSAGSTVRLSYVGEPVPAAESETITEE